MKFSLRLLTVLCYFLPFTFFLSTCNGNLGLKYAYNKAEAVGGILEENQLTTSTSGPDSLMTDTPMMANVTITEPRLIDSIIKDHGHNDATKYSKIEDIILQKVLVPAENSLSGIGVMIFYKNLAGSITVALSLLLSLIFLLAFKFIKSQRLTQYLLLANISSVIIFIIDSFISEVDLLWGIWFLLLVLVSQLFITIKNRFSLLR